MVVFKDAPCCDDHRVGDDGSVWSRRQQGRWNRTREWRPLKLQWVRNYFVVVTCCNGIRNNWTLQRLVLEAFVGPCPDGMEACHNDGDPSNNRLSNLRWDTHMSNIHDKIRHGTNWSKIKASDVMEIRRRAALSERVDAIARDFGLSLGYTYYVINRGTWKHLA